MLGAALLCLQINKGKALCRRKRITDGKLLEAATFHTQRGRVGLPLALGGYMLISVELQHTPSGGIRLFASLAHFLNALGPAGEIPRTLRAAAHECFRLHEGLRALFLIDAARLRRAEAA